MAKADAHQIITGEDRKIQGHNTGRCLLITLMFFYPVKNFAI